MFNFKKLLILCLLSIAPLNLAVAFNFDFGDNDYHPYWGNPYFRPITPYYYMPQLPMYDRSTMVRRRQEQMSHNADAMSELEELLYGRYGFDRAEAIKLAKKIELASGRALSQNFHPGAVRDMNSHTTPTYWGNEETFRANALALQQAARELAMELEKKPTAEEGAVLLNKRWTAGKDDRAAVSPSVWDKYNNLSNTCNSCHQSFRGPSW
mgnify:FL=1